MCTFIFAYYYSLILGTERFTPLALLVIHQHCKYLSCPELPTNYNVVIIAITVTEVHMGCFSFALHLIYCVLQLIFICFILPCIILKFLWEQMLSYAPHDKYPAGLHLGGGGEEGHLPPPPLGNLSPPSPAPNFQIYIYKI